MVWLVLYVRDFLLFKRLCFQLHQEESGNPLFLPGQMDGAELRAAFGSGGSISTHRTQVARREILLLWEESPDGALTHGHSRLLPANAVEEGWLASLSSLGANRWVQQNSSLRYVDHL